MHYHYGNRSQKTIPIMVLGDVVALCGSATKGLGFKVFRL